MLSYLDQISFKIQTCIIIPFLTMLLIFSSLWNLYFIKMARLKYKSYIKYLNLSRTDSTDTNVQCAYCFRTEFNKYLLLLAINLSECGSVILYGIGYGLGEWLKSIHQTFLFPQRDTHNCSQVLTKSSSAEIHWVTEIPIGLFIISIAQGGVIFSMVLSICLMKYIHAREYNRSSEYTKWNKRFLSIMILIVICLIVLGTVPQLVLAQRVIEPIIQVIVVYKWVRQIRRFHQTLKMLAFDCQVNRQTKDVCRRAILLARNFKIIMSLNIAGLGLGLLTEMIANFKFIVSTGLYYGPCLFHYLYGTPLYTQAINSKYQVEIFMHINNSIDIFERFLIGTAIVLVGSHYFIVSILFFGSRLMDKLNIRFKRRYRTRFTPDLSNPLLIQPESNRK